MLNSFPEEILFVIMEHIGRTQLLTPRLVNRTWSNIATEVLSRVRTPVTLRTTMCVKYFVYLMANRSHQEVYTKFEFHFEHINLECVQQFAAEIRPQVREYSFTKSYSTQQILTLLQNSPNLEVITLHGISFDKDEILSFASDHDFPKYLRLSVIKCKENNKDFTEVLKLFVNKTPTLELIYLDFGGKASTQVPEVIQLLPSSTKVKMLLKHGFGQKRSFQSIINVSRATTNTLDLYIHTSYGYSSGPDISQAIIDLLQSQSGSLKRLCIESCSSYAIPPLRQLESLSLIPHENWEVVPLSPEKFSNLYEIKLHESCTLKLFNTSTWPNVTTLDLCSSCITGTSFLSDDLASIFPNLRKLVLKSSSSLENDLKCCFRRFTQLEELNLEFENYEEVPSVWAQITGGATYAEDMEFLVDGRPSRPSAKDASLENLRELKKLQVKSCRLHTLNAILYVSFLGNFKLEVLDLTCHKDCDLKAIPAAVFGNFEKHHKNVFIK